jgi:hypothetical protein
MGAIYLPTRVKIPGGQPLVEQFSLGHAPSFPKPAGIIKNRAHRAS